MQYLPPRGPIQTLPDEQGQDELNSRLGLYAGCGAGDTGLGWALAKQFDPLQRFLDDSHRAGWPSMLIRTQSFAFS
jgi:hypothetical protein